VIAAAVVVLNFLGSQPSSNGRIASPTSTTNTESATATSTYVPTATSTAATPPPSPQPVGGWGPADALAKEFQGLLPPTPDGVGYGSDCSTGSRTIFGPGIEISCGSSQGCSFDIDSYPGNDAEQHFYDLAPARGNNVERWQRGAQTGRLRIGPNSTIGTLDVIFDDPGRHDALLMVLCRDKQPFNDWWPNAPL
jgi:hypothetical protein